MFMSALSALLTACQVGFWSRGVGSGKYAVTRMLTVLPVPGAPWFAFCGLLGKLSKASVYSGFAS